MSRNNFKKWQCRMSVSLIFADVPCRILEIVMSLVVIFLEPLSHVARPVSPVEFKKWTCRRVVFRGLDPYY